MAQQRATSGGHDETDTYHLSLWPESSLPQRPIICDVSAVTDGFVVCEASPRLRDCPDEIFLREMLKLELASDQALSDFLFEFGCPAAPVLPHPERVPVAQVDPAIEEFEFRYRAVHRGRVGLSVARVRHTLALLRGCSMAVIAYQRDEREGAFEQCWQVDGVPGPDGSEQALRWTMELVSAGLGVMQPRLTLQVETPNADPSDRRPGLFTVDGLPDSVDLYSAVCIQIANSLHEGAVFHQCANTRCGNWFSRQAGRAIKGQHRTLGVKYCSTQCAKAQGARDRRARNKVKG